MRKPQTGVACAGCPHRAAFVVVKDAVGRGRGRVFCGDAGCSAVGPLHPAATTCPGGEAALMPRYRQAVPAGDEEAPATVCAHFVPDRALLDPACAAELDHLAREGATVLLCVLASRRDSQRPEGQASLVARARELGCTDVAVLDPFDTLASSGAVFSALEAPGVHGLVFASPCAQLMVGAFEPAEVNAFACMGCQRCNQITACPRPRLRASHLPDRPRRVRRVRSVRRLLPHAHHPLAARAPLACGEACDARREGPRRGRIAHLHPSRDIKLR